MKKIILMTAVAAFAVAATFGQERGALRVARNTLGEQASASVGRQYALFIAIDKYKEWNALRKPVSDAMEIRDILHDNYFIDETIELYDAQATRANIAKTFSQLQGKLGVNDSLFVYYAGHGHLDKGSKTGFWIPVDGGLDQYEQANWLPNAVIRGYISGFKTIHVFLVSDACFSGDILNEHRGRTPEIDTEYYRRAYKLTSREVLTSGSSETVPDESEFSSALKMCLRKNVEPLLDPMTIYNDVKRAVRKTTPLYGTLSAAQHQDGAAFLFFRKERGATAGNNAAADTASGNSTVRTSTATGNLFITTIEAGRLRISGNGVNRNEDLTKWGECSIEKTPAGDYTLTMTYSDGKTETKTVEVGRNTTGTADFAYRLKAAATTPAPSKLPTLNNSPSGKAEEAYNRGLKYGNNGDYDLALAEYAEAIRLNPGYAKAYDSRAYIHNNRGAYDLAIADCTEAIRLDPKFMIAYVRRSFAYNSRGSYDLAAADCTEAIRLDPRYAMAYYSRGVAYSNKKDYDRAIADYNDSIRLNPKYAYTYVYRGIAYHYKGDYDRVIADTTEAIRLNPKFAEAYYNRALAYKAKGDAKRADADFAEAKRLGM
jgi:tetratricopeptide (TPR) repeat protein